MKTGQYILLLILKRLKNSDQLTGNDKVIISEEIQKGLDERDEIIKDLLSKYVGLFEEIFEKSPQSIDKDNYEDYKEAKKRLWDMGIKTYVIPSISDYFYSHQVLK